MAKTKLFVLLLSFAALGSASAGVLKVNDEDGILSDRADLEAAVAAAPFDVLVVATTKAPSKADFDHYLDGLVPSSQSVVVGLDIAKHHSHAIAGRWVRISGRAISAACEKGNPYFKERKYGSGLARIVTEIAAGITPVAAAPIPGTVAPSGLSWLEVLLGGLAFGIIVWGIVAWVRSRSEKERERQRKDNAYFSGGGYREPIVTPPPPFEPAAGYGYRSNVTPPPVAQPSTVIVGDRGSNLTDYLVLDHLLNHSQSAPAATVQTFRSPDPAPSRAPDPDPPSSGGSDWSSGGGSSGGSDFGGGGFDSGGGSSGGGDW